MKDLCILHLDYFIDYLSLAVLPLFYLNPVPGSEGYWDCLMEIRVGSDL